MRPARTWRAPLVLGALAPLLAFAGCSSEQESYCGAVKDHQSELADVLGGNQDTALLRALPIFTDLEDKAPDDIVADWRTVVGAVQGLRDALDAAGVDPASYDRDKPPDGVSQTQRTAIDNAAAGLTRPATVAALDSVQQQSLDVCHTPLSL